MTKTILYLLLIIIFDLNLAACGTMPPSAATSPLQMPAARSSDSTKAMTGSAAQGFTLSSPEVV
jgi:hypothetical protein